jgi:hypothetical protein
MNIFAYLNDLLFGPTLQFVAATKYSLDDAVDRLRASVIPKFSLQSIFREGLKGTVRSDWVCLRWKTAWNENGFRPMFRGRFVSDASGVRLVGLIGMPTLHRVLLIVIPFLPPILLWVYLNVGILPANAWPIIPVPLAIVVIALIVSRAFRQRDYQLIADALDNALS